MFRRISTRSSKDLQFIDWRRVLIKAGDGGDGCAHLLRTAGNRKAGPDGGNGGVGGSVVLEADISVRQLRHINKHLKAESGKPGRTSSCHGRNGKHLVVKVPPGTSVKCNGLLIGDLKKDLEQFVVSVGGTGGYGNVHFKSPSNRRPLEFTKGELGQELAVELELKTIADVGLVGFPNAGKSTLLRAISNAKPAVAAYPFTTRNPYVGMVEYEDHVQVAEVDEMSSLSDEEFEKTTLITMDLLEEFAMWSLRVENLTSLRYAGQEHDRLMADITIADIPGLIEDAHLNKGLGHSFLRHIERCRCLLYVIDMSLNEPAMQMNMLKKELDMYKTGLSSLPAAVVANKIDILDAKGCDATEDEIQLPLIRVSGKYGTNINNLKLFIRQLYEKGKAAAEEL